MPILEAKNLYKTYAARGKSTQAVRDVSLTLEVGEVLAFLGPNGAGKTTTIKMIAGLVTPDAGTVRIDGLDPHNDAHALRSLGAVLEGNRNIYWRLTAEENLLYFGALRGITGAEARARALELLGRFELLEKRNATVQTLSRGMQQKLAIAVALMHSPRLLLLDEPTLGLDVEAAETVKELVKEISQEGHAILLTTHQLDVAEEISDRVAIIRKGCIIAEEPTQELISRFSGTAYTIEVGGELTPAQLAKLTELQALVKQQQIEFLGDADELWQVLEILKPLPLKRVVQDQADLTEIFLRLVREGNDG